MKAAISYQGIQRVETFPVPESALRETILNAIIHRNYAIATPLQIRVYADRLRIWNPGELPEHWSREKLLGRHSSQPFNPDVANAFFRAGEIEAWGRGIQHIFSACREAGTPSPQIEVEPGELWTEFAFSAAYLDNIYSGDRSPGETKTPVETPVEMPVEMPVKILTLLAANPEMRLSEVAKAIDKSLRAVERASTKLVREGRLRHVGPRKVGVGKSLKTNE